MGAVMKRLLVALALGVFCLPGLAATVESGAIAYKARDFTKALSILRPLAEKGSREAQDYLGMMYASGQGVAEDDAKAVHWFRKAAVQGGAVSAAAQHGLTVLMSGSHAGDRRRPASGGN